MLSRLRRRSRELAAERGELTSHVGEMISSVKLVRAYVAEAFELDRFTRLAERGRSHLPFTASRDYVHPQDNRGISPIPADRPEPTAVSQSLPLHSRTFPAYG